MSGKRDRVGTSTRSNEFCIRLALFWYFDSTLIALIGWFHDWAPRPAVSLLDVQPYAIPYMLAQALVATSPLLALAAVLALTTRRLWVGFLIIAISPLLYVLDQLAWLAFNGGLFEAESWGLAIDAVKWCIPNLSLSRYSKPAVFLLLMVGSQLLLAKATETVCDVFRSVKQFWRRALQLGLILIPLVLWYASWLFYCHCNPRRAHLFVPEVVAQRQPIEFFRIWLRTPDLARHESVAGIILPRLPELLQYEEAYQELAVTERVGERHDVVLVIVECLRPDGITARSAPNLTALARRSFDCQAHYSSGNCSGPGTFGLLFGADPLCYPTAVISKWPAALPKLLGQMGYHRVFLGTGKYHEYYDMKAWISPEFDVFDEGLSSPFHLRDASSIETAVDILNRTGPFAAVDDRPVFVVLYLYTPHYPTEAAEEDCIFELPGPAPDPPWSSPDEIMGYYLNSIHTVDRLLKPVLESDAVVVVTGDHGESFGEDGGLFHGSEITVVRSHTPMVVSIPGESPARIKALTSHGDITPTVMDAIGVEVNRPESLTGTSLLKIRDRNVPVRDRVVVNNGTLCGAFTDGDSADKKLQAKSLFRGNFLTGVVRVPATSLDLLDSHLTDFLGEGSGTALDSVSSLIRSARSGEIKTRLRALELLLAYPEYLVQFRHDFESLKGDSEPEIRQAANRVLTAIDGLLN